ncbi:MAG: HPP family protein [Halapricum sp.]
MFQRARERLHQLRSRLSRLERREIHAFRRWIENTRNLLHLSILVALPLLLGIVTALANAVDTLPYLLFPPLASGSYTLFANPESRYASPRRFVGGLTAGAISGWVALVVATRYWYRAQPGTFEVDPVAIALGLFLTGAITWALDIEEASAFSTALLVHVTGTTQITYVASVAVSSALVAGAFVLWRETVYEQRARFIYESTKGDDNVLVPTRGRQAEATAMLGARLAADHDAGKVVLLDVVEDDDVAAEKQSLLEAKSPEEGDREVPAIEVPHADPEGVHPSDIHQDWSAFERTAPDHGSDDVDVGDVSQNWAVYDETELQELARERAVAASVTELEARADRIETVVGVPCEVVVAAGGGSRARTIVQAAEESSCDLITVPYETEDGRLAPHVRDLFRGPVDVLVHRSYDGRTRWSRVMVPVRKAGDVAHSMIDFATRLAGDVGAVSVCHCIDAEQDRRPAEEMLANLAETASGSVETRVARDRIESFLKSNAAQYDLVVLGSSQERSAASRFISRPTFERVDDLETDVAIVDRNY